MWTTKRVMVVSLSCLWAWASPAAAESVINGHFTTDAAGWTVSTVDQNGGWRSTGGNPGGYFALNHDGMFPDPTLSQDIAGLVVGAQYVLTGDLQVHIHWAGTQTNAFTVEIDGQSMDLTPTPSWQPFAFNFTYTGTSSVLKLMGERYGSDVSSSVDNISIQAAHAVVPTPMAVLLGLPGLALAAFGRRWIGGNA